MPSIPARRQNLQLPQACANPGLEMDRYVPTLGDKNAGKNLVLGRIANSTVTPEYVTAYQRWKCALERLPGIRLMTLHVAGRMIVGLGTASVLETGITLSRAWGMPYIPGSALKGLANHTVAQQLGLVERLKTDDEARERCPDPVKDHQVKAHHILFGTTASAGYVTWHDAWWIPNESNRRITPFRRDVMTVHHQAYYQQRGGAAPTDFDDPNPVSYLSVAGDFLVAIQAPNDDWGKKVVDILTFAFQHRGAGAKTSSGYGRGTLTELQPEKPKVAESGTAEKAGQRQPVGVVESGSNGTPQPVVAIQARPAALQKPKGLSKQADDLWRRVEQNTRRAKQIPGSLQQWHDDLIKLPAEIQPPIAKLIVYHLRAHEVFENLVIGAGGKSPNKHAAKIHEIAQTDEGGDA